MPECLIGFRIRLSVLCGLLVCLTSPWLFPLSCLNLANHTSLLPPFINAITSSALIPSSRSLRAAPFILRQRFETLQSRQHPTTSTSASTTVSLPTQQHPFAASFVLRQLITHIPIPSSKSPFTMSANLDKSLDELVSTRRQQRNRRGSTRRTGAAKTARAAVPVGGVKKTTRNTKVAGKGAQVGRSAVLKESKIIVSGLVSRTRICNSCHE